MAGSSEFEGRIDRVVAGCPNADSLGSTANHLCRSLDPVCGVPATPLLADFAFLFQPREYTVEVVLLDAHTGGELRNTNPRMILNERERLRGA
jgi:hypothetical protein